MKCYYTDMQTKIRYVKENEIMKESTHLQRSSLEAVSEWRVMKQWVKFALESVGMPYWHAHSEYMYVDFNYFTYRTMDTSQCSFVFKKYSENINKSFVR